ncbi:MAG: hypothetical protein D6713_02445 [Deltaproteobacteria bacterium]|nr:MAG: hypothetical protein D6713_02445 [Deltaproteobacteria bacterium]
MKKLLGILLAAVFTVTLVSPALAIGPVGKRQIRQQKRIHQGIRSGQLTPREAFRLEKEQVRIQRTKRRFLSDGDLTCRERVRLHMMQDRASRHIYRLKHNDRTR